MWGSGHVCGLLDAHRVALDLHVVGSADDDLSCHALALPRQLVGIPHIPLGVCGYRWGTRLEER